jgi:hypothetical protein
MTIMTLVHMAEPVADVPLQKSCSTGTKYHNLYSKYGDIEQSGDIYIEIHGQADE